MRRRLDSRSLCDVSEPGWVGNEYTFLTAPGRFDTTKPGERAGGRVSRRAVWGRGTGRWITPMDVFPARAGDFRPRFRLLVLACRDCGEHRDINYSI